MMIKVTIDEGALMPTKAHTSDAGFDLYTPKDVLVSATNKDIMGEVYIGSATIDTGVHVAIPEGYVGMVKSKSGLNVNHGLVAEGVIDAGYTGSIVVKIYNLSRYRYKFHKGDKIAQLVIMPISTDKLELVDKLEDTERGNNGFGSTGR